MEMKKAEKLNKYLDLARELKEMKKMSAVVIPMVIGTLTTDS